MGRRFLLNGCGKFSPTGIRSPYLPDHSDSRLVSKSFLIIDITWLFNTRIYVFSSPEIS